MEMEDAEGHRGVKLSKDLMKIAGRGTEQVIQSPEERMVRLAVPRPVQQAQ
jgi:hypothetical protein